MCRQKSKLALTFESRAQHGLFVLKSLDTRSQIAGCAH
jgi:hypothetical protein